MGGPMTSFTLRGLGNLAPLGMASAEPPIPTGMIGAPVRDWTTPRSGDLGNLR